MDIIRKLGAYAGTIVAENPLWAWGVALLLGLAVFFILLVARRIVVRRLRARAEAAPQPLATALAELLARTWTLTLLFAGITAGTLLLRLPPRIEALLGAALIVLALIQSGLWVTSLVGQFLEYKLRQQPDVARSAAVLMIGFGGRLAVWTIVLLLALDNLGVDVTALIAGLGIGGIAMALAVQHILGDVLGSVVIALDKPFEIGDFVIVGGLTGTVEHIGLKTTRVRSLYGEQLVFSNSDLLASRIQNFKRMKERRVVLALGVTYQTPVEKLEKIPEMMREIIEAQPDVRFDRAHFQKYGDSALVFEVVYSVNSPEYNLYMDRQQAINLAIYRRFAEAGIEFAYPTQTLFIQKVSTGETLQGSASWAAPVEPPAVHGP